MGTAGGNSAGTCLSRSVTVCTRAGGGRVGAASSLGVSAEGRNGVGTLRGSHTHRPPRVTQGDGGSRDRPRALHGAVSISLLYCDSNAASAQSTHTHRVDRKPHSERGKRYTARSTSRGYALAPEVKRAAVKLCVSAQSRRRLQGSGTRGKMSGYTHKPHVGLAALAWRGVNTYESLENVACTLRVSLGLR